jgi:hypothetical protein
MTPIIYDDCHDAIRSGNAASSPKRPCVVAYHQGRGWTIYHPSEPDGGVPELLCYGGGTIPVPLSEAGRVIIYQLMEKQS